MTPIPDLDTIVAAVMAAPKYRHLHPGLVRRIAAQELAKGRKPAEVVKETRTKLHQVGSAYQEKTPDYATWKSELAGLPKETASPEVKEWCRDKMKQHASTSERLSILDSFFPTIFEGFSPFHSVLDLACGLNPLASPWMPLADDASYYAFDIFTDMAGFLSAWLKHCGMGGEAGLCDLIAETPSPQAEVALLLKTIPCLEQVDKNILPRLMEVIPAALIVVSFPVASLGGKNKGMRGFYTQRFEEWGQTWQGSIKRFDFASEVVYRLQR
jgi:16S rRNA (guanine(1405)-N(7))-methyltransferase